MAAAVMAYNNTKTTYEASMRRLMDDIDADLANNAAWVDKISDNAGKIIIGTISDTKKQVFVKSGTRTEGGKIVKNDGQILVVNKDGSINWIDGKLLSDDFEEVDANEVKHDLDMDTYNDASRGLDLSAQTQSIGMTF